MRTRSFGSFCMMLSRFGSEKHGVDWGREYVVIVQSNFAHRVVQSSTSLPKFSSFLPMKNAATTAVNPQIPASTAFIFP